MDINKKAYYIAMIKQNEKSIDRWIEKKNREQCKTVRKMINNEITELNDTNNRLFQLIQN